MGRETELLVRTTKKCEAMGNYYWLVIGPSCHYDVIQFCVRYQAARSRRLATNTKPTEIEELYSGRIMMSLIFRIVVRTYYDVIQDAL